MGYSTQSSLRFPKRKFPFLHLKFTFYRDFLFTSKNISSAGTKLKWSKNSIKTVVLYSQKSETLVTKNTNKEHPTHVSTTPQSVEQNTSRKV